jgi:hypothetical protein
MKKIIGITGLKRSGKDTTANYLNERHNYDIFHFAEPLKDMITALLANVDCNDNYFTEYNKEENIPTINQSYRTLAQTLGTEWGRSMDTDLWIRILEFNSQWSNYIVIPDLRFNNEAKWIKDNNGIILKIIKDTGMIDNHSSESGIYDNYIDHYILNDSTIEDLYTNIDLIFNEDSNTITKDSLNAYLNSKESITINEIKDHFKL